MSKLYFEKHFNEINNFISSTLISRLENFQKQNLEYFTNSEKWYKEWKNKLSEIDSDADKFKITAELHKQLELKLQTHGKFLEKETIFRLYEQIEKFLTEYLDNFETERILDQEEIHFTSLPENGKILKAKKIIKSVFFSISRD